VLVKSLAIQVQALTTQVAQIALPPPISSNSEGKRPEEPQQRVNSRSYNPTPASNTTFSGQLGKELSKKLYTFPESCKLTGPENYDQWLQSLNIMLTALGVSTFIRNFTEADTLPDADQAMLLMLIRDSLGEGPQKHIAWAKGPSEAYTLLTQQYAMSADLQRDSLYREFHSLNFSEYTGSLVDFNAKFNSLLFRLRNVGASLQEVDTVNLYMKALEKSFPV
jgi:hypothetical protein